VKRKSDTENFTERPLVSGWPSPSSAEVEMVVIGYFDTWCTTQSKSIPSEPKNIPSELRLRVMRLWTHWRATKNNYFAIETITVTAAGGFPAPNWAIEAVNKGFLAHLDKPKGDLSYQLGLRRRGSGKTQPWEEYLAWKKLEPAMDDMHTLCEFCGISAAKATEAVIGKHEPPQKWETLVGYYNTTWRPFYRTFGPNPLRLTADEFVSFRATFPKNLRYLVAKVRTKNSV
jgi:hypothetical protein